MEKFIMGGTEEVNKKKKNINQRDIKGITLIALVITIIVAMIVLP